MQPPEPMGSQPAHEGEKVREMLDLAERSPIDLAHACAVSESMARRYLKTAHFGAKAWETVSRGLVALGLDPRRVRQVVDPTLAAREEPERLVPLLNGFGRRQMEALLRILDASEQARYVLRVVVKDRLNRG